MRDRAKAKQVEKHYELIYRPIQGTLNGRFVRKGEDLFFCGFPEPWVNSSRQRVPKFEIFFNLQLQDNDDKERAEPNIKVEQSMESDSDGSELGVGVALACLLINPSTDLENLGDNLTISMIREELGINPTSGILDASGAPSLIWQLDEGYLSSSESSYELESDSIESVGSRSDSSSSESESGISGGGNPDTKVLSRSSFSFSFEFVTEDLGLLNENSTDFVYFSVPLIYCIDQDFQNFNENEGE